MAAKRYTDEYLIDEVKRITKVLGRPPIGAASEFPGVGAATKSFGSWEQFLSAADLTLVASEGEGEDIKERYIKEANEIIRILGRTPKMNDFDDYRIVKYYFGSWQAFKDSWGE
ncbi:hypothetical protein HCJ66_07570 [Listeria sp. FSL L7-1582]|uniref:homing endonuclease associated repeat-containing protein n=1 Tax=Listeria portnoyi TaxID=2713504 RepID=UPI00164CEEEF|nr:hypothetical protein [Listeria portnoyi]MBC6309411.1 hypothetical protein [Listeria portnoyi]